MGNEISLTIVLPTGDPSAAAVESVVDSLTPNSVVHRSPSMTRMQTVPMSLNAAMPSLRLTKTIPRMRDGLTAETVGLIPNTQRNPSAPLMFSTPVTNNSGDDTSSASIGSSHPNTTVVSTNGRTWRIQTNGGLEIATLMFGGTQSVQTFVGNANSVSVTRDVAKNEMRIEIRYSDRSPKWITIKLDSPAKVEELKVHRRGTMVNIEENKCFD